MRTLAALLVCLLPSLGAAQSGVLSFVESSDTANGGKNDKVINIAECEGVAAPDTLATFSWTLSSVPVSGTWYKLYAMLASCPTAGGTVPATGIVDLTNGFQATSGESGSWTPPFDARVDILVPLGVGCTSSTNVNLCVTVYDATQASVLDARATAVLKVDATTPAAPVNVAVTPGESALNVTWAAGSGGTATASSFTAFATGAGGSGQCSVTGGGSTGCRIGGLVNGEVYGVVVVAYSESDNPSPDSAEVSGTPEPVDDFWRHYKAAGGREEGGCGQGGPGPLALLPLLPLAPRLRRRAP